ncbi:beta-ketoacyl synthase N-terminal-like domain-containing protein [Micromonospora sp. NPDC005203]|uniref:beta-ketoacyl synthase N-terminal-like domain-containing protein n=1 Tax=Micromonospora sp. NPDC005203 TaxID=3364226 RepID=UPI00367B31B8
MNTPSQGRVVVVGVGAITSQGPTAEDLWLGASQGQVAIRPVEHMSMDGYRTRLAGEVVAGHSPKHDVGYPTGFNDRALDFALIAAEEAMGSVGLGNDAVPAERWGVVLGTCNAGLLSARHWYLAREHGEPVDPRVLLFTPPQAIAEALAGAFGVCGPVLSVNTACAAGANAIGYAADLIRSGRADAVLAGGTDALSDVLVAGFNSLESLSPVPAAPYSKDRQGLSLGEGSGMLVLVRADLARELGRPILAEVAGLGLSADGYHATAPRPDGTGAARAIQAALRSAGRAAEDVVYVNSHGTGTAKNDPAETMAMKVGLGDASRSVAVSSTKSMIGHLLGAAGAVEAIVTVKAIEEQLAPPTASFTAGDPDCDLDYTPNVARRLDIGVAMSNNFAFGGANASLVLTRDASPPATPTTDRVVITGVGVLSSAGVGTEVLREAFANDRRCTTDESGARVGRVPLDVGEYLTTKARRRMDRLGIFSVVAARLALQDAGLTLDDGNRTRVGTVLGTGIGPMDTIEAFARPLFESGPRAANPALFPNTVYNAATGQVSMHVGAVGPTTTVTTGHAAGAGALAYAFDILSRDEADGMLAIAADTLTDTVIDAYGEIGPLTTDGFGLAEAGIAVLLERAGVAAARGASPRAELLGYGIASDGRGVGRWDRDGHGVERALRDALERAGLRPSDVAAVWTNTVGLPDVDDPEDLALARLFEGSAAPPRFAPKRLFGEPIGAGAPLALAVATAGEMDGPALVVSSSLGGTHIGLVLGPVR